MNVLLGSPVHKHGFNPPREQEASGDQLSPPCEHEANGDHLSPPQPKIAEEHSVQPETNDGRGEVLQHLLLSLMLAFLHVVISLQYRHAVNWFLSLPPPFQLVLNGRGVLVETKSNGASLL